MATSHPTSSEDSISFDQFFNVINGKLETTASTTRGINPSTLEGNPAVPLSTREDVDRAVQAARTAAVEWAKVPYAERQAAITRYAAGVEAIKEALALMLTKEQGKPLNFARSEITSGYEILREGAEMVLPEEVLEDKPGRLVVTRYTPIGVVVGIVPWNFPVMISLLKIGPALLAGNAIILKPSLKLVELAQKYFPAGVVQVLSGDDDLGPWLVNHPNVDKISFTGSTSTGKRIMQDCGKTLKRVTLELGGNDPAIVCKNVNVKDVAPKLAMLAMINSGQLCVAIKRLYVHEAIYDELLREIVKVVDSWTIADGLQENATLGPVSNKMQFEKVKDILADIKINGYKIAAGFLEPASSAKGYFIKPTIVDNPPDDSRVVQEEAFGPVLPLLRWSDEDDVIRRANNTLFGLGASVWSFDKEEAARIADQLKAGAVWTNAHAEAGAKFPIGGHKESGIGAENGLEGLKHYCNIQTLVTVHQYEPY